jgi:hypothetical protein
LILLAVRWYLRYGLSYRDVEELLAERGIDVDHVTIYRWVQRFTPLVIEAARPCRHSVGDRWFVDETYVRVADVWRYVYRAVDQYGQVIDVHVSRRRNRHCCIERSRMVRAVDPIHIRRTSRPPEQGKWGQGRGASRCGRLEYHLAMAQRNSALRLARIRQRNSAGERSVGRLTSHRRAPQGSSRCRASASGDRLVGSVGDDRFDEVLVGCARIDRSVGRFGVGASSDLGDEADGADDEQDSDDEEDHHPPRRARPQCQC